MSEMTIDELHGIPLADALGVKPASAGTRFLALLIDVLVWLVAASPAIVGGILFTRGGPSGAVSVWILVGIATTSVFGLVQLILHGRKGITVGKALMRLRSVSATTLGKPGFWRIVLRALVLGGSGIVVPFFGPLIMLVSGLWNVQGRSWLDRVANIWLVDVRQGLLDPFDEKGMRRAKRAMFAPERDISEHLQPLATGSGLRTTPARERSAAAIVGISRTAWVDTDAAPLEESTATAAPGGGAYPAADRPVAAHQVPAHPVSAAEYPTPATTPPTPAPVVSGQAGANFVLVFDDESAIFVQGDGIIGRAPDRIAERPDLMLVPLDDPVRQLSKSHLAFGVDARGLWIEDLGSSNGTYVTRLDGVEREIERSARTDLGAGDRVRIGGRAFQVRMGSDRS